MIGLKLFNIRKRLPCRCCLTPFSLFRLTFLSEYTGWIQYVDSSEIIDKAAVVTFMLDQFKMCYWLHEELILVYLRVKISVANLLQFMWRRTRLSLNILLRMLSLEFEIVVERRFIQPFSDFSLVKILNLFVGFPKYKIQRWKQTWVIDFYFLYFCHGYGWWLGF